MQRYFAKEIVNNTFELSKDDTYHIIKVMRMNLKDKIEVVFNEKEYICEIIELEKNVKCKIINELEKKERKIPKVTIAQSLVKEQKMDYILQKATELGIHEIIPTKTERSIVKLDTKESKKIERWNKVLKEASEQSKRHDIPILTRVLDINELIDLPYDYKLICSVNENTKTIKSILSKVNIDDTILLVIGPEGGLSLSEEEKLIKSGFISITFGDNVLRTETASLFALSVINYEFLR